jgi:hypothetical protein
MNAQYKPRFFWVWGLVYRQTGIYVCLAKIREISDLPTNRVGIIQKKEVRWFLDSARITSGRRIGVEWFENGC